VFIIVDHALFVPFSPLGFRFWPFIFRSLCVFVVHGHKIYWSTFYLGPGTHVDSFSSFATCLLLGPPISFFVFFFLSWPFSGRPAGRPHGNLTLQHVRIFPKKKSEEAANKKNIREHGAQNKYFQDKLWAYSLGSVSPAMKCLMGNGKYLNFYKLGGAHKLSVRNSCGFHGFSFFFPAAFFFSFVWRILFVTFRFFVYLEAIVVYLDASQIFSAIGLALPFPFSHPFFPYIVYGAYSI